MKAVEETDKGLLVFIEVAPKAIKFQITGYNPWREKIEIRVKSPPTKGKANQEIIKEIGQLTQHKVELISGQKSQYKTLLIPELSKKEFLRIIKL